MGPVAASIGWLQFAPPSHAAIFPFSAMSVMGGVSGVEASSQTLRASIGEVMFAAAGTCTLYTFSKIVSLLVMTGLIVAVTTSVASTRKA